MWIELKSLAFSFLQVVPAQRPAPMEAAARSDKSHFDTGKNCDQRKRVLARWKKDFGGRTKADSGKSRKIPQRVNPFKISAGKRRYTEKIHLSSFGLFYLSKTGMPVITQNFTP